MQKTTKYVLLGAGGLFVWWFVDRNVISIGFPHFAAQGLEDAGAILRSGRPAVAILGLHDAGQTMVRSSQRHVSYAPLHGLFGMKGAGQVLAATTLSAQYNPPGTAPPMGSSVQARPDVNIQDRPAAPPVQSSPQPVPTAQETAGDKGIATPLIVGGLLILLVVLYFIAK